MVFPSYSSSSYLPLDSNQSVAFYRNENLQFSALPPPPQSSRQSSSVEITSTFACSRNSPVVMLTSVEGSELSMQGSNMQPITHLSSNGYYGYVPTSLMPKTVSTERLGNGMMHAIAPISNGNGIGVPAAALVDDSMMDSSEMANYQQHQEHSSPQPHLRKRKENIEEEGTTNCKRRKTWLGDGSHPQCINSADFPHHLNWSAPFDEQMEFHDQPMEDTCNTLTGIATPVMMNGTPIGFNHQQPITDSVPSFVAQCPQQQPQTKNNFGAIASIPARGCLLQRNATVPVETSSSCSGFSSLNGSASILLGSEKYRNNSSHEELENMFISLHGSGFYMMNC